MDRAERIQEILEILNQYLTVSESQHSERAKAKRLAKLYTVLVNMIDELPVSTILDEICIDASELHNVYRRQPFVEEKKDQVVRSLEHNIALLTHTESNIFEFRRRAIKKKSVKRSRKTKKSVKRSRKARRSIKRSRKVRRSVKRSRKTQKR